MGESDASGQRVSRRGFIEAGVYAIGGAVTVLLGIPLLGYLGTSLLKRDAEEWVPVCPLDSVPADRPAEFRVEFRGQNSHLEFADVRGVFVIRKGSELLAFSNICTHMGCSVRWLDWRQQVLCPCHGGMYDRWGNLMGGPPAASLPRYPTRLDGNILYISNRGERS